MNQIYLVPLIFVGITFTITTLLKLMMKIKWPGAMRKRNPEIELIDQQLKEMRVKQKEYDYVSKFVEHAKIERQINKLLMRKEKLLGEEIASGSDSEGHKPSAVFGLIKKVVENSLFLSLVIYYFFRSYEVPFNIDYHTFFPMSKLLGFDQKNELTFFTINPLFVFLTVRFCNRINSLFID